MPIELNGQTVGDITLNGNTIGEVTVNGTTVYKSGPEIILIEDWESGSITGWSGTGSQFQDITSSAITGNFSGGYDKSNFDNVWVFKTSGEQVQAGDTVTWLWELRGAISFNCLIGDPANGAGANIYARHEDRNDFRMAGDYVDNQVEINANIDESTVYRTEIELSTNEVTGTVFEQSNNNQVITQTKPLNTPPDGYIGYGTFHTGSAYCDDIQINRP